MRTDLSLKTQIELRDEVKEHLNDSSNQLATDAQYTSAINKALNLWAKRVTIPHVYSFSFADGVYDYALPSYITAPFEVQVRSSLYSPQVQSTDTTIEWADFMQYGMVPNSSGGTTLRSTVYPISGAGTIIWHRQNGPVPTGAVTVTLTITASDTSVGLTVSGAGAINESGWIKIDNEWIAYAGVTRTSAGFITLTNLGRGQYATTAASHTSTTAVYWGVAVDDDRLWQQLYDRAGSFIHMLHLHKSTAEDTARHEKLYGEMKASADSFWNREGYVSQRKGQLILTARAMGSYAWL